MMTEPAGLYIHIPFCLKKCRYCDFYSITDLSRTDAFVDALVREMGLIQKRPWVFDTIYLGGGTPSVLSAGDIETVVKAAFTHFNIRANAEITMEVNPGTVQPDDLANYRSIGVNRLNMGAQSFSEDILRFLGRIHTPEEVMTVMDSARRAGFDNIGLDLIYGLPGQTAPDWRTDMQKAVSFFPEHLSCYTLTYENGTPLKKMVDSGSVKPLDDAGVADLFKDMQRFLKEKGYLQYEIANWAREEHPDGSPGSVPSRRSRHNQKYWKAVPYIGLGPSAHSFVPPERCWNVVDLETYLSRLRKNERPIEESEILNEEQRLMETLYLSLRTVEGIDIPRLESAFKLDFQERYGHALEDLVRPEMLERTETRCALTAKGMRFLDGIAELLVSQSSVVGSRQKRKV